MKYEKTGRQVRRKSSGEVFLECPLKYWLYFLDIWKKDHKEPCPMPVGHLMFKYPDQYGMEPLEDFRF